MSNSYRIAFDVETTGLHAPTDRVVEIGAVVFDGTGKILDQFWSLINPGIPIPEEARRVHNISNQMVAVAPLASEVIPSFLKWVGDTPLCAHNASFDAGFIGGEIYNIYSDNYKFHLPDNTTLDTLALVRSVFTDRRRHRLADSLMHVHCKESEIIEQMNGSPSRTPHRALYDAFCVKEIYTRLQSHDYADRIAWNFFVPGILELPPIDLKRPLEFL
jgi:DNA polymerase III subunit epsilon